MQDHQKQKRLQPQSTYADALPRTRHTKPPEEEKIQPQGTHADTLLRTCHITPLHKDFKNKGVHTI